MTGQVALGEAHFDFEEIQASSMEAFTKHLLDHQKLRKFGWGISQISRISEHAGCPASEQLTQSGDISVKATKRWNEEEQHEDHYYFLLRPVENICVTEANLASLDVSHIQPTWIVAEPHKESAIIEVRKQKFRNEHRLTLVEFLLLVDKARVPEVDSMLDSYATTEEMFIALELQYQDKFDELGV